jgi:hypothetical protein
MQSREQGALERCSADGMQCGKHCLVRGRSRLDVWQRFYCAFVGQVKYVVVESILVGGLEMRRRC